MKSQGLDRGDDHTFDVLTVIDPETNKESRIYFNIDLLIAHQEKLFAPEKEEKEKTEGNFGAVPGQEADPRGMPGSKHGGVPGSAPGGVLGGVPASGSASGARRVEGGVLAGRALARPQPEYPAMARAAGVDGTVIVEVLVNETGAVESARAISGHPLLRTAAVEAAKNWVFDPTLLDSVPVKVLGTISFNFKKG